MSGRILTQWQCTPLNCGTGWFQLDYTYNLLGAMATYTDGVGHTFTQNYNAAAQLTQLTSSLNDAQHPGTLASNFTYNAVGAAVQMMYGNGVYGRVDMNTRLQPCRLRLNAASTSALLCTDTDPSGDIMQMKYGFVDANGKNNGNVLSWTSSGSAGLSFSRSYTYDELNRLKTMSSNGSICTALEWTYDPWGNRTNQNLGQGGAACGTHHPTINTLNRIAELSYDAAGNVTQDGSTTFQYDAEHRLKSINGGGTNPEYTYDANGRRVRKKANGTTTEYIYGLGGNVIAEKVGTTWTVGYVYLGGALVAQYKDSTTYFVHKDRLGSTRLLTKVDKSVQETLDYLPYGEQLNSTSTTTRKFTGKGRDTESGLDYFGARFYVSLNGRFLHADPVLMTIYRIADPQEFNLFTYVRNNPLIYIDPTGEIIEFANKKAQLEFEEYERELNKDPKKNKELLDTIQQLKNSEVSYVINIGATAGEGSTTTNGSKVLVTISNIGNGKEQFSMNSRFARELEHARQFDSGEWGFLKDSTGKWTPNPNTYDIFDEVGAWNAQLSIASPRDFFKQTDGGPPTPSTLRLFANAKTDDERAGVLARSNSNYNKLSKTRADNNVSSSSGLKPGDPVQTDNSFFRVRTVRP